MASLTFFRTVKCRLAVRALRVACAMHTTGWKARPVFGGGDKTRGHGVDPAATANGRLPNAGQAFWALPQHVWHPPELGAARATEGRLLQNIAAGCLRLQCGFVKLYWNGNYDSMPFAWGIR